MPNPSVHPSNRLVKALALSGAAMICQGFYCSQKHEPPSLPSAVFTDIQLKIKDPELRSPGIYLAWDYPSEAKASVFEIYQSFNRDSLKHAVYTQAAEDSQHVILPLSDTTRPYTLYFAVRAVLVEATGQKLYGDTLVADSISITPSLTINAPSSGAFYDGRTLNMEVQTSSDPGVSIRFYYYEKSKSDWAIKQAGCLPRGSDGTEDPCTTIFGHSVQRDSLTLEQHPPGDTVQALFCVVGTESFEESHTGLMQSLGCKGFYRVNP
ncbi:MAG: hypothetical protein JWP91_3269 [Fibrobacteres bacterium]|nr:hypothetical protein [Fibrobacterota bacterium]